MNDSPRLQKKLTVWWKCHEHVLPLLAKLAKGVLTVPASSAKSECLFSTGGNFVTAKRNSISVQGVPKRIRLGFS